MDEKRRALFFIIELTILLLMSSRFAEAGINISQAHTDTRIVSVPSDCIQTHDDITPQQKATGTQSAELFEQTTTRKTKSSTVAENPRGYFSGQLGIFNGTETPGQLERWTKYRSSSWAINGGYFIFDNIALGGDLSYFNRDYTRLPDVTPLPGTYDNHIRLTSIGISVFVKAVYPIWRLRPYTGTGLGFYDTQLYVTDPANGLFVSNTSETSFGYQLFAGIDFVITNNSGLGLEYRKLFLRADFGPYTNGMAEIGGDMVTFTYRYYIY